jgi:hypothetical protein
MTTVFPGTIQHSLAFEAPHGSNLTAARERVSFHLLPCDRFPVWKCRLIWAASHANMGCHIMKTTIEIADDLFERVQRVARKEKTTFRSLTEQGLRIVLKEKQGQPSKWKWKPVTFHGGGGLTDEFKNALWEKIRDEIYRGHGA